VVFNVSPIQPHLIFVTLIAKANSSGALWVSTRKEPSNFDKKNAKLLVKFINFTNLYALLYLIFTNLFEILLKFTAINCKNQLQLTDF
jgi:hypothetical protein